MSNSSLVNVIGLSPFTNGKRRLNIDRITPHCIVGNFPAERLPQFFDDEGCSCNYAIAEDGRVALIIEEDCNSWCSSNENNDQRSVTIECSCDIENPYEFNVSVFNKLIELTVDICRRNNMDHVKYLHEYYVENGVTKHAVDYDPPVGECQITLHRFFANKACPGDWFVDHIPDFVKEVNSRLSGNHTEVKPDKANFCVHVGAFRNSSYADNLANKANQSGIISSPAEIRYNPHTNLYEVSVATCETIAQATDIGNRLKDAGFQVYIKPDCTNHTK